MTVDRLQQVLHARPFRPFDVCLADGRKFTVKHPEWMAHSPNGRTAVVFQEDDSMEIIDLLLVTSISLPNGSVRRENES